MARIINWKYWLGKLWRSLAIGLIIGWLSLLVSIYRVGGVDERQRADAIIVLGASQWNGQPSPMFRNRLEQALALYVGGYAPNVVLTGGVGVGEKLSEAGVGRNYLQARGMPASVIFLEERGRTTYQSLRPAVDMFKQKQWRSVLLVSHDFHMFRLKRMARDLGITPIAVPVVSNRQLSKWRYAARESVVYVLYRLFKV